MGELFAPGEFSCRNEFRHAGVQVCVQCKSSMHACACVRAVCCCILCTFGLVVPSLPLPFDSRYVGVCCYAVFVLLFFLMFLPCLFHPPTTPFHCSLQRTGEGPELVLRRVAGRASNVGGAAGGEARRFTVLLCCLRAAAHCPGANEQRGE